MKTTRNLVSRSVLAMAMGAAVFATPLLAQDEKTSQGAAARNQTQNDVEQEALTPTGFAHAAALANIKEVRLGHLALQQSQNSEVKQMAQQMIDDHSEAYNDLKQITDRKNITLPPMAHAKGQKPGHTSDSDARTQTYGTDRRTDRDVNRADRDRSSYDRADRNRSYDRNRTAMSDKVDKKHAKERETVKRLKNLSGQEFDRAYVREMVNDHMRDVEKFQQASQNLADSELRQYATEKLPTLRQHLQDFQRLERSGSVTQRR